MNPSPSLSSRAPVAILGVRFDNLSMAETVQSLERMIRSGEPHYAVTANVDFLVQAREDIELRRLLFDAHLVLCDGTPLVWASRIMGTGLPERIAGADLVPRLIEVAAQKQYRVFFLGATPAAASLAAERVCTQHPGIAIAGYYSPPFRRLLEMDHDEIVRRVRLARPDMLFVSFGCPKQEKWIGMHYRKLGVPVTIGVGATIDFLAGQVRRAPVWMQRSGLEWLFRLAQEPGRLFRRYSKDLAVFGVTIARQWWLLRPGSTRHPGGVQSLVQPAEKVRCFQLPSVLDHRTVESEMGPLREIRHENRGVLIDTRLVNRVDSAGIGFLMGLQREANSGGLKVVCIGPGSALSEALDFMRIKDFFVFADDIESGVALLDEQSESFAVPVSQIPADASGVSWHGEITAVNVDEVWMRTTSYLRSGRTQNDWTLNLAEVSFLDSSGLGLILRLKKSAMACGKDLCLVAVGGPVLNVIRLAGLESFLLNGTDASLPSASNRSLLQYSEQSESGMPRT